MYKIGDMVSVFVYGRGNVLAVIDDIEGEEYFLSTDDGEEIWASANRIEAKLTANGLERAIFKSKRGKTA